MSDPIRECGSCSACCTVIGVPEIGKGTYEACDHICEVGCGIYADRPGSCRTFECEWLRGMLEVDGNIDPELRPDSCGVILDYQPGTAFGAVYRAWEIEPGASATGHVSDIIEGLAERFLLLVMTSPRDAEEGQGDRRLIGPPHLVSQASDVMWSRPADAVRGVKLPTEQ